MTKLLGVLVGYVILPACAVAQQAPAFDFSAARSNIANQMDRWLVPSISVAVVYRNNIVWEESFGWADRENRRKATVHTPYYVASVNKTLTAMALMRLTEKGMLHPDSSVNRYLRVKLPNTGWDASAITARRLIQHTGGLTTFNARPYPAAFISKYAIPVWKPGTYFDYSNIGYVVLTQLLSDVSGKSYADFMQREIFDRLRMHDSYVTNSPNDSRPAVFYLGDSAKTLLGSPGDSMMVMSAHDLALLGMQFLRGSNRMLSDASVDLMLNTPVEPDSTRHGFALNRIDDYFGDTAWLAQGGTTEAQASLQILPSRDLAVIVLSNTGSTDAGAIVRDIVSAIVPAFSQRVASSGQTAAAPRAIPATLPFPSAARYDGLIRTYRGDIPVSLQIRPDRAVEMRIGEHGPLSTGKVSWQNSRLSFEFPFDLAVPDAGPSPYKMKFSLLFDERAATGVALTAPINDRRTPNLPF